MKSTIDLAREAGLIGVYGCREIAHDALLETFRALCVAERDKELMGVGMEPTAEFDYQERIFKWARLTEIGYVPVTVKVETLKLYDATQLAAARLQGAEEAYKDANMQLYKDAIKQVRGLKERITELEALNVSLSKWVRDNTPPTTFIISNEERSKVAVVKPGYDAAPSIEWLCNPADLIGKSLYAGEQERSKREPLSADELWLIWNSQGDDYMSQKEAVAFARLIERAHGIGEQG